MKRRKLTANFALPERSPSTPMYDFVHNTFDPNQERSADGKWTSSGGESPLVEVSGNVSEATVKAVQFHTSIAVRKMKEAGFTWPAGVRVRVSADDKTLGETPHAYATFDGYDVVLSAGKDWAGGSRHFQTFSDDPSYLSSSGKWGVIVHEIAHATRGDRRKEDYDHWYSKKAEAEATAAKVSKYATTNPDEFVAETFAGIVSGRTYSQDVKTLYVNLGGQMHHKKNGAIRDS